LNAVMITMELRTTAARDTAVRLLEAGVSTEVFVQPTEWPVGPESNRANALHAIKWAATHWADEPGFLFVEDDIIINPHRFIRATGASILLDEIVYFYMHDKPPRTKHYPNESWIHDLVAARQYSMPIDVSDWVVPEGVRPMSKDAMMYGSQCIYIPMRYVNELIGFMSGNIIYSSKVYSRPTQPFDYAISQWRISSGRTAYCYLPHPVQHLQDRTGRSEARAGVYSLSYDLVSDLEVAKND
jgi:hypothetical protein